MSKSKKEEGTEIAAPQSTAMATPNAPRRGFEQPTDSKDLLIPRVKLLQALSPEVQEDGARFQAGMIINSITKEALPSEFVPIFNFTNWIRFNPRNPKDPNFDPAFPAGSVIWRSNDKDDSRVKVEGEWGSDGTKPKATKFLNFFCLFPGVSMPIILGFSNTSYKAGKSLLSLATFAECDMFARKYVLKSKKEQNDMGQYFIMSVDAAGKPSESDYLVAESWWDKFHSKLNDLKVHEENEEGTVAVATDAQGEAEVSKGGEGRPF